MKWIIAALALSACFESSVEPYRPDPPTAPGPQTQRAEDCAPACKVLVSFNCELGQPTPGGKTCTDLCLEALGSGYMYWPSTCISQSRSIDDIEACGICC